MEEITITTEALEYLTSREVQRYRLLPCTVEEDTLVCLGEDNRDYTTVMAEIEVLTGKNIQVKVTGREEWERLVTRHYRQYQDHQERGRNNQSIPGDNRSYLHQLIEEAYLHYASDIHLEIHEERCRVRFRIDGKLIERHIVKPEDYPALVNQVKIMANLDISEKRLPQDGRIFYQNGEKKFDVRVSSLPTIHGEKVVMRLLTRHVELLDLKNLGFEPKQLEAYCLSIKKPHGLILISGPTGSGKSTTLYATLRMLNEETRNILTIEDPVEYTLQGINQVQLKEDIGLDFTTALRSFLRQDPDIIMLGEIRDADTAQMAIRSSLTGHLLLSTIHTNSAWGSVSRLIDMGVHPYLLADTLISCIAQRLVRLLCPHCKQQVTTEELPPSLRPFTIYKATGCPACFYTGYRGRKAIYEVIPMDETLAMAIRQEENNVERYLQERGIPTLAEAALTLLKSGQTSLEEVISLLNPGDIS